MRSSSDSRRSKGKRKDGAPKEQVSGTQLNSSPLEADEDGLVEGVCMGTTARTGTKLES